ncbi:MAG: DUF1329 domain-containing protein [bacterium]
MRKIAYCGLLFLLSGALLGGQSAWAMEPYELPAEGLLKFKGLSDDPTPLYPKIEYYKKIMPQEAWDQCVFDPAESRAVWAEAVGFKAPDVVGKIAPEIPPGNYTLEDKQKYPFDKLMTPYHLRKWNEPGAGGLNHAANFTEFEILPTRQYWFCRPWAEATLKNSGKTQLDSQGYLVPETYAGGFPFPRPSGEHHAIQILYNQIECKYYPGDFIMYNPVLGVSPRFGVDHYGTSTYKWLKLQGRAVHPPYGWYDERARKQGESLEQIYTMFSPRDFYGNVFSALFYADPRKVPTTLAYVSILRRVRKLSSSDRQDQAVGQDFSYDDADFFAQALSPEVYPYEIRIRDEREYLMPASAGFGDWLDSKDRYKWKDRKFERRPVWVIEMIQKDPNYIYSKRVLYVDRETLRFYLEEVYDQKGRLYRTQEAVWEMIEPMGYLDNTILLALDFIDVHSSWTYGCVHPALWLNRDEVSLKGMMRSK